MSNLSFRVPRELAGERLDHVVALAPFAGAHGISRKMARSLVERGAVSLEGRHVRASSHRVRGGERVVVRLEGAARTARESAPPPAIRVLHQDAAVVAIDKPAGLPSEPTRDRARPSALSLARAKLGLEDGAFLGLPHRLDRDTSGVLILAKDRASLAALSCSFEEHATTKVYVALVHGRVESDSGTIESFLAPGKKDRKEGKQESVRAGGKKAITGYRVLARGERATLVELAPLTGRTHQLRVHLSEAGHPIVGDELYGAPAGEHARLGRHLLHARLLEVPDPRRPDEMLRFESPLPRGFEVS